MPITPGIGRAPALPVLSDSSLSPLPRSSVPASDKLDEAVLNRALGVALGISLDVTQVTDVAGLGGTVTMGLAVGVDYNNDEHLYPLLARRGTRRTVGTG
ncbi:hypothetical protein NPX13_g8047 [Xylaria arbuscula]|uniref:Uncharacterized protein n=1 Tax=Xylaria arbuscula TaxID=114810 RepID=A0A9W8TIP9_9PEZI|nr:hypothetical protein NPX13_g8047 [Xylaria arbuscula]